MTPLIRMNTAPATRVTFDLPVQPSSGSSLDGDLKTTGDTAVCTSRKNLLSRLVSQDEIPNKKTKPQQTPLLHGFPQFPDPLQDPRMLRNHVFALRLEADLYPLRLILSRLMFHSTHNRKGIFNEPVDPVALRLPDYHQVISRPMDLGTIKRRLYAVAYESREEAIEDIRLVFTNAMQYNPPSNPVHVSARELLSYFDSCCQALDASVSSTTACRMDDDSTSSLDRFKQKREIHGMTYLTHHEENDTARKPVSTSPPSSSICCGNVGIVNICTRNKIGSVENRPIYPSPTEAPGTTVPKHRLRMPKRRASVTIHGSSHVCDQCKGRTCSVCFQGCLHHEPALLVCSGAQCAGSRIRKGAVYFTTKDGTHQICDRCFAGLPSTLLPSMQSDSCRYKQDLLKRKNDEEIAEEWTVCNKCTGGVHVICAMRSRHVQDESQFVCLDCRPMENVADDLNSSDCKLLYTFISGSESPVPLSSLRNSNDDVLDSSSLKETGISKFIQEKVKQIMRTSVNADRTISVRVISDCNRQFSVPKPVQRYFRMADHRSAVPIVPPDTVNYQQKAIVVFQKIDGLDVCVFCMYTQEYDDVNPERRRVYVAYIDSVEHFRPRELRTPAFQEILVAYLATARERKYTKAHIWACPPSRGNCFVFWNHPASQRVPTSERLQAWYHNALSRSIDAGVVIDVKSLYESDFEQQLGELWRDDGSSWSNCPVASELKERMVCPPLIDGDFWMEEAVRVHQSAVDRNLKVRPPNEVCVWNVGSRLRTNADPCPALQVASLLKDRIMTHPSSVPFRRPVNAAALNLKNYHTVIKTPVDLGTIYSRCILGEYHVLRDVAKDVIQMVANAKAFNPAGHIVNSMATEVLELFYSELNALTTAWDKNIAGDEHSWESYETMSMSLGVVVESSLPEASPEQLEEAPVVVIEDDRSSDGSRSVFSSAVSECSRDVVTESTGAANAEKGDFHTLEKSPAAKTKELDLHEDGPRAILQKMAGRDVWLLNRGNPALMKKLNAKRRRGAIDSEREPERKKRRQTWLCEEVGDAIRKMRTSFFVCMLSPKAVSSDVEEQKLRDYQAYVANFTSGTLTDELANSSLADARAALLELSQYRNFEFDTLRRAKYSTSMLLYYLCHPDGPGAAPMCTSCGDAIRDVRWHKAKKISELSSSIGSRGQKSQESTAMNSSCNAREDLCDSCYHPRQSEEDFIPIPVSTKP